MVTDRRGLITGLKFPLQYFLWAQKRGILNYANWVNFRALPFSALPLVSPRGKGNLFNFVARAIRKLDSATSAISENDVVVERLVHKRNSFRLRARLT